MFKNIDGSQGEGGGQILRSSLTLSAVTGAPVRIHAIRAGRAKPGLLAQHLTAVRAAQAVSGASVVGDTLGSSCLEFVPGPIRPGNFEFAVGTAGSSTLVCQTVLGVLLRVPGASTLTFSGGTHNPLAPPYDFLELVYFPILARMGAQLVSQLDAVGFCPAGGGSFRVELALPRPLAGVEILERPECLSVSAWTLSSRVSDHVAERELATVQEALGLTSADTRAQKVSSAGSGNVLCIRLGEHELVTAFGQRGRRSEGLAAEAVGAARAYLGATHPVGEHLADQLIVPCALAGGSFRTGALSSHTRTNIDVVRAFLGSDAVVVSEVPEGIILGFPGISGYAEAWS